MSGTDATVPADAPAGAAGRADGGAAFIDTHCHLDAAEFDADRDAVVGRARAAGVSQIVLPAVDIANCGRVRDLAHEHGLAYALGIHPLCVDRAHDDDLDRLRDLLAAHRDDPRLVAVGEIGIDHFVPGLDRERQERYYAAQLRLATDFGLPVLVHVRRSADTLLKHLRRIDGVCGIVHAFNASAQQAQVFVDMGFRLGFGGAMTFDRALQIRRLAASLPDHVPVLETDAPDIPPHWLYRDAGTRRAAPPGAPLGGQARNESAELPRIAAVLAELRGWSLGETIERTGANALAALPRLAQLMEKEEGAGGGAARSKGGAGEAGGGAGRDADDRPASAGGDGDAGHPTAGRAGKEGRAAYDGPGADPADGAPPRGGRPEAA